MRLEHASEAGFTLVELMLVVTLIGIVSAIAVPRFILARGAALEASTIGSLRRIHGAQTAYASSCGGGFYASTMPVLARRPTAGGPSFIDAPLNANSVDLQGYRIRFSAGPRAATSKPTCNGLAAGAALQTYFVEAGPITTGRGGFITRYFGFTPSGVIYQSTRRVNPVFVGEPVAPARPIQ